MCMICCLLVVFFCCCHSKCNYYVPERWIFYLDPFPSGQWPVPSTFASLFWRTLMGANFKKWRFSRWSILCHSFGMLMRLTISFYYFGIGFRIRIIAENKLFYSSPSSRIKLFCWSHASPANGLFAEFFLSLTLFYPPELQEDTAGSMGMGELWITRGGINGHKRSPLRCALCCCCCCWMPGD